MYFILINSLFLLSFISILIININKFKIFKENVALLSPNIEKNEGDPFLEILREKININEWIILPSKYQNQKVIIQFARSGCIPCHQGLQKFIKLNKNVGAPFICLLTSEDEESKKQFINEFPSITIISVNQELIEALKINLFPTYLMIDEQGIILKRSNLHDYLLKFFDNKV